MSHFSFNKPEGACETRGLGQTVSLNMDAVFQLDLSLRDGGVAIWYSALTDYNISILKAFCKYYGFAFDELCRFGITATLSAISCIMAWRASRSAGIFLT